MCQGVVWVLESEKVPKNWLEKASKEQKKKKEFFEVTPVKKHAKIKEQSLILTESDGSCTIINLKGCTVEAVSATSLPSRKWYVVFTPLIYNFNFGSVVC